MNTSDLLSYLWMKTRTRCLKTVQRQSGFDKFISLIEECGIDLLDQYTEDYGSEDNHEYKEYYLTKLINQHAFQAYFTEESIRNLEKEGLLERNSALVLVDIGDSAGSHLKYQKKLLKDCFDHIEGISVNLDPIAVEKIKKRGGTALLCRAEEYRPNDMDVSVYLSYEMVEHLHNPSLFFYRLAKSNNGKYIVVTVPYRKKSRVAVTESMEHQNYTRITAEHEHIFELSPDDYKRLLWHSGWKVKSEEIYYQYPKNSILTCLYRRAWEQCDFEGFYAMLLERDMSAADKYTDWEE